MELHMLGAWRESQSHWLVKELQVMAGSACHLAWVPLAKQVQ